MGQYWIPVNLDKHEFILPHMLGSGLKLSQQVGTWPGTGSALLILCAAQLENRGGGDLDIDRNWHGPERKFPEHNISPGPMPATYPEIARATIGRWAGDRVAIIGDYAEDSDLPGYYPPASMIYDLCTDNINATIEYYQEMAAKHPEDCDEWTSRAVVARTQGAWTNISTMVAAVIEHELWGKFVGDRWKRWEEYK